MSSVHSTWQSASVRAAELVEDTGLNVAIRKAREFGKERFVVSLASNDGSDLARAEIVKPGDIPLIRAIHKSRAFSFNR